MVAGSGRVQAEAGQALLLLSTGPAAGVMGCLARDLGPSDFCVGKSYAFASHQWRSCLAGNHCRAERAERIPPDTGRPAKPSATAVHVGLNPFVICSQTAAEPKKALRFRTAGCGGNRCAPSALRGWLSLWQRHPYLRVGTRKFTRKVQFADAHCSLRHPTKPVPGCVVAHTEAG